MMEKKVIHYSLKEVRKAGKKDGRDWRWRFVPPSWPFWESKEPDPPVKQPQPSQYESKLVSIAHENLERIGSEWSREDEGLTSEYCNAKNKKEDLESLIEKENREEKEAIIQFEKARNAFFNYPPRWVPLLAYWVIFLVMAIGEGFFNYIVFQIFGQAITETSLMAVAIILALLVASELLGHHFKKKEKTSTDKFLMGFMALIALIALSAFAILREIFFEASQATGILNIPINPTALAGIFITLNFAFFVALTYLSYTEARIDPEGFRKAKRAYEEAEDLFKETGEDAKRVAAESAEAEVRFNRAHSKREHTFEKYKHGAEEERDIWVTYVREYRHGNMNARKDKSLPESFKIDPEGLITIPAVFQNDLDWSCPDDEKGEKKEKNEDLHEDMAANPGKYSHCHQRLAGPGNR